MGNLAPHADNLNLGKGQCFGRKIAAGVLQPELYHFGNINSLTSVPTDDTIELRSSMSRAAGVLKKVTRGRTVDVKITGNDFALKNIALVMMGQEALFNQSASSTTGAALTGGANAKKGAHYRTANRVISAVTVKQLAVSLVAGTDYEIVDATAGLIRILPGSVTITEASPLTIDYSWAAITNQPIIRPYTDTKVELQFVFIADPTSGPNYEVIFWYLSLTPDGELGFIQDDWGEWSLNMTAQDDSKAVFGGSASEPYGRVYERTVPLGG